MTNDQSLRVEGGSVVALRFYDLGGPVDLDAAARAASGDTERPQFPDAEGGFRYGTPPLEVLLDEVQIPLEGGTVYADATARVFDFGVVAVALRVLVGGLDWSRFEERVDQVEEALAGSSGRDIWRSVLEQISISGASRPDADSPDAEHLVVALRRLGGAGAVDDLLKDVDVPALITNDRQPLSSVARAEILRTADSWHSDDMVIVGTRRTLIVEPKAGSGVPDAVEAAIAAHVAQAGAARRLGTGAGTRGSRSGAASARVSLRRAGGAVVPVGNGRLVGAWSATRDRFRSADVEAAAAREAALAGGAAGGRPVGVFIPLVILVLVIALVVAVLM